MRRYALVLPLIAALACDKSAGTNPPAPDDAPPTVVGSEEKTESTPQDERLAAAEAKAAKSLERWTPELRSATQSLRETEWKSLEQGLDAILSGPHRTPGNPDRDGARHPKETLAFFGLTPAMHVFEVGQGAGWYTEVLAPLLAKQGKLYLAGYDADSDDARVKSAARQTELFLSGSANLYDDVELVTQPADGTTKMGEPNSMDMVLVFRMMHNVHRFELWDGWMNAAHQALKPGGVLAIVQHRSADDAKPEDVAPNGYMPEPWLIEKVESYGFELESKSEINANPKDTKDHPGGVWSLPPVLRGGEDDKARMLEIGESDRSTLKFVKKG